MKEDGEVILWGNHKQGARNNSQMIFLYQLHHPQQQLLDQQQQQDQQQPLQQQQQDQQRQHQQQQHQQQQHQQQQHQQQQHQQQPQDQQQQQVRFVVKGSEEDEEDNKKIPVWAIVLIVFICIGIIGGMEVIIYIKNEIKL